MGFGFQVSGCRARRFLLASALLLPVCVPEASQALEIRITAASVQYQGYALDDVVAVLEGGGAALRIDQLTLADDPELALRDLDLRCDVLDFSSENTCVDGPWSFSVVHEADSWQLPFFGNLEGFRHVDAQWALSSSASSGKFLASVSAQSTAEGLQATLRWQGQQILDLPPVPVLPAQLAWVSKGDLNGLLAMQWPLTGAALIDYEIAANSLGFDSPDGRFAGENLEARVAGRIRTGAVRQVQAKGDIHNGALLIDNFYTSFADPGLKWEASLSLDGTSLGFSEVHISDGRSLDFRAAGNLDMDDPLGSLRYRIKHFEMHFPDAYEKYMESMASVWTLDGLTVTGDLIWSGEGQGEHEISGVLDLQDLSIVDSKRGRFAVTGLAAHIKPGDQGIDSRFSWRGLLFQRINLGAGEAGVIADESQFSLASPLQLDVLGGKLTLEDLRVQLPGSGAGSDTEPEIRLYASLENMDMRRLTEAMAWPSFEGSISGKIPGITFNEGVLAVEGQIEFNIFDGKILLSGLRVERPFGVLPSLAADLEVSDLDLQQLTGTFSFGRISGRMSGFVHELRMLDWNPVAFDAWLGTPAQEKGSHEISRQAVNHLTTIGGGSATAALTGPLMKLFNNFSYKRLGLGCRLKNNICEVRGLDDDAASVLIMEGAGVPKVMIRAFNRQMDWPTLLRGLSAASAGESITIGK